MSSITELSSTTGQLLPSAPDAESPRSGSGIDPVLLLKRHIKLAGIVFLSLLVLGGLALHHHIKPMYSASSIVYVSPTFPSELGDDREHERRYDDFIEQQVKSVTRYETLESALRAEPEAWRLPGESEQSAIERLQALLQVAQVGHSYEVSITLNSPHGEHLAELVNAITTAYLEATRKDEVYGRDERISTLTEEKDKLKKQLDTELAAQDALLGDVGMARYGGGDNPYDAHLAILRQQLADAHEKRAEAESEWNSLRGSKGDTSAMQAAAAVELNADPAASSLKTQLETRRATLMMEMNGLTPSNPVYQQAEAEIKDVDRQLDQFTAEAMDRTRQRIRQRMLTSQAQAAGLESALSSDLGRTMAQASSAAPKLQRAQVLAAEIDRLQRDETQIESRVQNLALEGQSPGSVHLFSSALPPSGPMKNKKMLYYGGLVLLSLFAGGASTLLAEAVDPHVYTSADVRRIVGFPPIGVLLSPVDYSAEVQKEYFLRLASGLDQAYRRGGARTFVFPSMGRMSTRELVREVGEELAGSGLHVLVVNVLNAAESREAGSSNGNSSGRATAAAAGAGGGVGAATTGGRETQPAGRSVEISGDLRDGVAEDRSADHDLRGQQPTEYPAQFSGQFSDQLPGSFSERRRGAGFPNSSPGGNAPAGARGERLGLPAGPGELIEGVDEPFRVVTLPAAEISDVLRRSRTYYNTILVAADPLFTSAYTEHFARIADGTVLIVDSGRTRKEELARAARLLERLRIKGIAIILTGVSERRADEDVSRTLEEYKLKSA